ncbi:hypothetical protein QFC20_001031 [Naganishia adeliensis]|uniref:Uncharacterized protein n=1 Tax=Naganishia adeliensis TaxID=92952 RepID=A0ACC2WV96_9TREE|nr:hypothetical protein QFC20_001031 [Naganishia adeliensis]
MSRKPDYSKKLVVVGDGGCGKTCLLTVYAQGRFPEEYVPTVFENMCKVVPSPLDPGKYVDFSLWDTAGQEDFDRIRPLSYGEADVVVVVFAVNYRPSLGNVQDKWSPEISHFIPSVPVLLVGTKIDLRTSIAEIGLMRAQGTTPITKEEGEAVAREIGARAYLECSSRTGQGVAEVFEEALRLCLKGRRSSSRAADRRKKKCVVL